MKGKIFNYGKRGDPLIRSEEGGKIVVLTGYDQRPEIGTIVEYHITKYSKSVCYGILSSQKTPHGLLEVVTAKELMQRGDIENWEYNAQFMDKTVMRFRTLKEAAEFTRGFMQDYFIPKHNLEEEVKRAVAEEDINTLKRILPHIARSGPLKDGCLALSEMIGATKPDPHQETWLIVPNNNYHEIQEYINTSPTSQ